MDYLLHRKPLFHELQTDGKVPQDILEKLTVVPADLQRAGLGLSEQDEKRLVEEVQFVIHSAASISFFEHVHWSKVWHTLLDHNYEVRMRVMRPFHHLAGQRWYVFVPDYIVGRMHCMAFLWKLSTV